MKSLLSPNTCRTYPRKHEANVMEYKQEQQKQLDRVAADALSYLYNFICEYPNPRMIRQLPKCELPLPAIQQHHLLDLRSEQQEYYK